MARVPTIIPFCFDWLDGRMLVDGGNTITGFWEKSGDGEAWEHDFDLAYTKQSETTTEKETK